MESLIPELALYGSKIEFGRTKTLSLPLSQISTGAVSIETHWKVLGCTIKKLV